jgi:hypothetical protein
MHASLHCNFSISCSISFLSLSCYSFCVPRPDFPIALVFLVSLLVLSRKASWPCLFFPYFSQRARISYFCSSLPHFPFLDIPFFLYLSWKSKTQALKHKQICLCFSKSKKNSSFCLGPESVSPLQCVCVCACMCVCVWCRCLDRSAPRMQSKKVKNRGKPTKINPKQLTEKTRESSSSIWLNVDMCCPLGSLRYVTHTHTHTHAHASTHTHTFI